MHGHRQPGFHPRPAHDTDPGPDRVHPPHHLVPEHHRLAQHEVADTAAVDVVQVAAAHPAVGDVEYHLARSGCGLGQVVDTQVAHTVDDDAAVLSHGKASFRPDFTELPSCRRRRAGSGR